MKQQLIKKAGNLFLRYGIRSVSMDDIAKELGISKKTLYQQVENKTELIRQILSSRWEEEARESDRINKEAENAIEENILIARYMIGQLHLISPSFRYDLEKYYLVLFKEMESFHWTYFLKCIEVNLEKGKKEGLYREDLDTSIITRLFMGMMNHISYDQIFPVHDFPLDHLFRHSFFYHLHGIVSPKGRLVLSKYLEEGSVECL